MNGKVKDLKNTLLQSLSLDEIVYCHLTEQFHIETKAHIVHSCLHDVETEMRQARGRYLTANYAPLLAAFAILDQIGSCYRDKAMPQHPNQGQSIHRALYYFGRMAPMSDEVRALYAFRNGLVHDASLTSHTRAGEWYIFRYKPSLPTIIKLAKKPWDGTAANLGPDTLTLLNVRMLTNAVSEALNLVRKCRLDRPADLDVLQTKENIIHKYLFWNEL